MRVDEAGKHPAAAHVLHDVREPGLDVRGDLRDLLAGHAELEGRVRLVEAADEWELADVDTPEDLARLEGALAERG